MGNVPAGLACSVLDAFDGKAYVWWRPDADPTATPSCCYLDLEIFRDHAFFTRPDWLSRAKATYAGQQVVSGVLADVWQAEGQYTNNYACAPANGKQLPPGAPVRFWERKSGVLKAWNFTQYVAGPTAPEGGLDIPAFCQAAAKC